MADICAKFTSKGRDIISSTKAHIEANKKYRNKKLQDGTIKQLNVTLNADDFNMISDFCKNIEISKASFITGACRYFIENNIPVSELKNDKST